MKRRFFAYCPQSGIEFFETEVEAEAFANDAISGFRDSAWDGGWDEDVTGVIIGVVTQKATMCDQYLPDGEIDADGNDEAGEYWDSDCESKCDYKLLPINTAGEYWDSDCESKCDSLIDALTPEVIDWVRCGLATNGRLKDGDHPALEKLRAAIQVCEVVTHE